VDKVLAEGRAVRCGRRELNITPEALDMLAARYIHCSANWNAVQLNPAGEISGGAAVSETIGFVNRPDERWRRTIYNMEGKRNEK
ncbi:Hcp1 family type VI secretion system effector, partial [Yokenella regensburgei ATCC 49455]